MKCKKKGKKKKNHQKVKLRKESQHAMERRSGEGGGGTANGPREKQEQQEYLQQKTEKFHLLSSPDAPTKLETGKRQTDGEKKKSCKAWNIHL